MRILFASAFALAFVPATWASDEQDRVKIFGTWQEETSNDRDSGNIWTLEDKAVTIHVVRSHHGQTVADFECGSTGQECEVTDDGHHVKLSMWFSGSKLVQLETRGDDVTKRRFRVTGENQQLEMEVIPIVPPGKTEVVKYRRVPSPEVLKTSIRK